MLYFTVRDAKFTINHLENACYRTIEEARQTCLDASMIHPGEGTILWSTNFLLVSICMRQFIIQL